ncbi:MAG: hypothetical protein M9894_23150 [Planctomycetes bacterium]|nr:hypothetical protein [Planctomycetota bacterium]
MIRVVARTSPDQRCGYCHGGAGDLRACSECGALCHPDCREELRRCTTIGCRGGLGTERRGRALQPDPDWLRPLHVAAAIRAVLAGSSLVVLALVPLVALVSGPTTLVSTRFGLLLLFAAAVAPVTLWVGVRWLLGYGARLDRARHILLAERPRRAQMQLVVRRDPQGAPQHHLMLGPESGGLITYRVAPTFLPEVRRGPEQEVTLYGSSDDPLLMELADGRLVLLFRD